MSADMTMNPHAFRVQRILIATGPVLLVMWLAGFVFFARFIPPPSPKDSPEEVLRQFQDNADGIRVGMWLTLFASALLVPFAAAISSQLRRIEGSRAPLSQTQFGSAVALCLEFIFPVMLWVAAAYRADDIDAGLIRTLNDLGWLIFVVVVCSVIVQMLCIAGAIFIDQREQPIFPRWMGYLTLWVAVSMVPPGLALFFKDGPFAWNGILGFYVPLTCYAIWVPCMTYVLLCATAREEAEAPSVEAIRQPVGVR
jgi:hypothetical protein